MHVQWRYLRPQIVLKLTWENWQSTWTGSFWMILSTSFRLVMQTRLVHWCQDMLKPHCFSIYLLDDNLVTCVEVLATDWPRVVTVNSHFHFVFKSSSDLPNMYLNNWRLRSMINDYFLLCGFCVENH